MLMTRSRMRDLGYPSPGGDLYYCLSLRPLDGGEWLDDRFVERVATLTDQQGRSRPRGAPTTTTWLDLLR